MCSRCTSRAAPTKADSPARGYSPVQGVGPAEGVSPAEGVGPAQGVGPAEGVGPAQGVSPAEGVGAAQGVGPAEAVSWRDLLIEAQRHLALLDEVETPEMDARRMVEAASGVDPAGFERALDEPARTLAAARFRAMVERRSGGEPLQYVVGSWSFRTLDLMVDHRVLIPRPETEAVAGWAISEAQHRSARLDDGDEVVVVDLGTGSGAIALSVAVECPRARVFATDVSAEALSVARANLAGLGRAAARVSLHEGDWYEALPGALRGSVDVVVSNPPYIGTAEDLPPVVADWEPPVALWSGPKGDEAVQHVIGGAAEWLRPAGALVLEVASHRAQQSAGIAADTGFADVRLERDLAGLERVVIGRRP